MSGDIIDKHELNSFDQITDFLIAGSIKSDTLKNSENRNRIINAASSRLTEKVGRETVDGIRVLLAASLTSPSASKELLAGTSLQPENLEISKAKLTLDQTSWKLGELGMGEETRTLRALIGLALLGRNELGTIKNLVEGSGVKPESLTEESSSNYIKGASVKISEGKLGKEGARNLRVLIGASLAVSSK